MCIIHLLNASYLQASQQKQKQLQGKAPFTARDPPAAWPQPADALQPEGTHMCFAGVGIVCIAWVNLFVLFGNTLKQEHKQIIQQTEWPTQKHTAN